MHRARLALALALALVALPPTAAASFELGAERIVERALQPGTDAVLPMPLAVSSDGFLYAKLLATPGNAVNDGLKANGSVDERKGWRISFALVREDGTREELGTFVDSTPTRLLPVAQGERVVLESTLHVPADAARGGPSQRAYVALAYREEATGGPGSASGATMDASRSLVLVLSNALLPPAEAEAEPPSTEPAADAPLPGVSPVTGVTPMPSGATGNIRVTAQLPTWFLVAILVLLSGILGVLVQQTRLMRAILRQTQPAARAEARTIPVLEPSAPRELPAPREAE